MISYTLIKDTLYVNGYVCDIRLLVKEDTILEKLKEFHFFDRGKNFIEDRILISFKIYPRKEQVIELITILETMEDV